jgi:hypothetical protein
MTIQLIFHDNLLIKPLQKWTKIQNTKVEKAQHGGRFFWL